MVTLRHKVILVLLACAAFAVPLAAQNPQLPAGVSAQDVRSRIRASGLSGEQIRQQLAQRGYDPGLLDSYLTDSATGMPEPDANVFAALAALSVPSVAAAQPVPQAPAATEPGELRVFGMREFTQPGSAFQPMVTGPVPGSYVVGPGDELVLVLTGDVEAAYTLPVTREGFIVIPRVGQVVASGIPLERLRDQMYTHLGRVYSGLRRGTGATTRFDLSLARLRTNQVFVTGEVALPGSYLLSPVASVMNGLLVAGGPREGASLRNISVVRGGRTVYTVDLYAYLLRGDNLDSVRLEPGDVIFVPVSDGQVAVNGAVNRPARYEVRQGETLWHLIRHAGGLTPSTTLRRARINRLLPPSQRREPGVDRTVVDVDLAAMMSDSTLAPPIRVGDEVSIFSVRPEIRNLVSLDGAVWQPGSYGFRPGMRAWDLINLANGLTPRAYIRRAHISRLNLADSTMSLISFSLDTLPGGGPRENPELTEYDAITVYDETANVLRFPVTISGEVMQPRQMDYTEGLTLRDLIIQAGGLSPRADVEVEVARYADQAARERGELARIIRLRLDSSYIIPESMLRHYLGHRDSLSARIANDETGRFRIEPLDQVLVRRVPFFVLPRSIIVTGQVRSPGRYTLRTRDERLIAMIQERAGGLTPQAFAGGFRLYRDGQLVDIDLDRALRDPDNANNLILQDGDSLSVPEFVAVVTVQGAVNSPSTVLYRPGAGLGHYIENAGGYAANADGARTIVRYANGEARVSKRSMLLFRNNPSPGPGSVVVVPAKTDTTRFDWRGLVADALQIVTAVTTIIIVTRR